MVRSAGILGARPYAPGDERAFEPARPPLQDWDWGLGPPGPTWTLIEAVPPATQVLGMAGLNFYQEGRAHLWAVMSDLSPRQWVKALPIAGKVLDRVSRSYPGVVVTADASGDAARRCLEKLGFVFEGQAYELDGEHYRTLRKAA